MAILKRLPQGEVLLSDLKVASSMWMRMKGLLGESSLADQQGLWIHQCNSIHTFFMKFDIDCVFLDKNLTVQKIVSDIRPGRFIFPVWSARSVIEMSSGVAKRLNLKIGDQLNVGH